MIYDVIIVGMGMAGAFTSLRIAEKYKELRVLGIDLGKSPAKRRNQLSGFLGCLPNSNGKLYQNDLYKLNTITTPKKIKNAFNYVSSVLSNINTFDYVKDKKPSITTEKNIKKLGYTISLNDYVQMYPKDIHLLSKYIVSKMDLAPNLTFSFDNEVQAIAKQKNTFILQTEEGEIKAKKVILTIGRCGWRQVSEMFAHLGIVENNDSAHYGIRIEMPAENLKYFNKSHCTLTKPGLEIGPFSWSGTVVPEDHFDVAISAYRENENRWASNKVSFNLIGERPFPQQGWQQSDRISKLTFLLSNDRIVKERVNLLLSGKSKISILPEYDWLKEPIMELSNIMPEILKAHFHVPTILPMSSKINLGNNFETEVSNLFVVGENAGIHGLLAAAMMGSIVADSVAK